MHKKEVDQFAEKVGDKYNSMKVHRPSDQIEARMAHNIAM